MERDLTDFDQNYFFEMEVFYANVKKIMNLNFFNRIKQFMIRLYRNNLFLGNKSKNMQKMELSIALLVITTLRIGSKPC